MGASLIISSHPTSPSYLAEDKDVWKRACSRTSLREIYELAKAFMQEKLVANAKLGFSITLRTQTPHVIHLYGIRDDEAFERVLAKAFDY